MFNVRTLVWHRPIQFSVWNKQKNKRHIYWVILTDTYTHTHTNTFIHYIYIYNIYIYTYIYIYIYILKSMTRRLYHVQPLARHTEMYTVGSYVTLRINLININKVDIILTTNLINMNCLAAKLYFISYRGHGVNFCKRSPGMDTSFQC